jgi:hypothetical protein
MSTWTFGVAVHPLFNCESMAVGHCVQAVVDIQLRRGSIMNTVDHVNLFFVHRYVVHVSLRGGLTWVLLSYAESRDS